MANIIFLDAPVGAGFSYATTTEGWSSSDTESAMDSYEFLRKWLIGHPQFLGNPLYIGGDSYSGIPVPIIVYDITQGNLAGQKPHINLQGYALGNPITDEKNKVNSIIRYVHRVGFIPDELYESAKNSCNGDFYDVDPNNTQCLEDLLLIYECTMNLFTQHILEPQCALSTPEEDNSKANRRLLEDLLPNISNSSMIDVLRLTDQHRDLWCRYYNYILSNTWANNPAVREALDIRNGTKAEWMRCNYSISYTKNVNSVVEYHRIFSTTTNYRVLVYRYVEVYTCDTCVVTGYTLTFATIRGGGHTVPEYRPKESFAMAKRWFAHYFL